MADICDIMRSFIAFSDGDMARISHAQQVYCYAKTIAELEGVDDENRFLIEAVGILHDVGIPIAMKKYGSCEGPLQEKEGPEAARSILIPLGFQADFIERICFLIEHHHTYHVTEDIDYQILIEADFLVNFTGSHSTKEAIMSAKQKYFKTQAGLDLLKSIYKV